MGHLPSARGSVKPAPESSVPSRGPFVRNRDGAGPGRMVVADSRMPRL